MRKNHEFNRREVVKTSALALASSLLLGEPMEAYPKAVNTNSSPSTLQIGDLRVATIVKPGQVPVPSSGSTPIKVYTDWAKCEMGQARRMRCF